MRNEAEYTFYNNKGHIIRAEIIAEDEPRKVFYGKLLDIRCNTFIIKTDKGTEMFRYEDVRYLQVIN